MIRERLEKLRLLMKQENIDLYYIPTGDFHQSEYVGEYFKARSYMSGFTGSAGSLIVTKEEACLFTDGRYHIQAEAELQGSGIHLFKCGEANVPSEEEYAKVYMKKHKKIVDKTRRPVCMIAAIMTVIAVIALIVRLVIPELVDALVFLAKI